TVGSSRPSSLSRARTREASASPGAGPSTSSAIDSGLAERAREVGDQVLRVGARSHLHQLPALVAVVVEDLLGGVDPQRYGQVLPARVRAHTTSLPLRPDTPGLRPGPGTSTTSPAPGKLAPRRPRDRKSVV